MTTVIRAGMVAILFGFGVQDPRVVRPEAGRLEVPTFESYEAEYTSAFGRFFNQVRPFALKGQPKISVLNVIAMPNGVIVDHSVLDRATLRQESGATPYFAWGQEYMVLRASDRTYDLVRVPLAGGEAVRTTGQVEAGGVFEGLGFSPTLAALPQAEPGTRFRMPRLVPRPNGDLDTVMVDLTVIGTEALTTPAGPSCKCTVLEETGVPGNGRQRYWVAPAAPFLFKRHRDIGGPREFVSELLAFRTVGGS